MAQYVYITNRMSKVGLNKISLLQERFSRMFRNQDWNRKKTSQGGTGLSNAPNSAEKIVVVLMVFF